MRFASIDESAEFIVRAKLSRGVIVNGATSVATRSISGEEAVFTHFLTLDFPRVQIFTLLLSPFGWISLKLQKPLTIWFGVSCGYFIERRHASYVFSWWLESLGYMLSIAIRLYPQPFSNLQNMGEIEDLLCPSPS
jgi:hypothetical protein